MSYSLPEEVLTDDKHFVNSLRQDLICDSFRRKIFLFIFINEDEHSCSHPDHTKFFYRNCSHINHKLKHIDQDEDQCEDRNLWVVYVVQFDVQNQAQQEFFSQDMRFPS